MAPYHLWVPDAYQGAPTPVTGFMGSAIKLAGFGLAIRVFGQTLLPLVQEWATPFLIFQFLRSLWVTWQHFAKQILRGSLLIQAFPTQDIFFWGHLFRRSPQALSSSILPLGLWPFVLGDFWIVVFG